MSDIRVLAVINSLGAGGAEQSLAESIAPLRERGVQIEVACFSRPEEGVDEQVRAETEVHLIERERWPERVRSLRALVQGSRPDLVHTMLFEADVAGRLSAARTGVPVLTSLVNTSYAPARLADPRITRWKFELVRGIDAASGRFLTGHFHALTEAVARSAEERLHIPGDRITVIPRGRNRSRLGYPGETRRLNARRALGVDDDRPIVLCVGRQEFQKGQRFLLEAAVQFQHSNPRPLLVLAGRNGAATEELRQLQDRLELNDDVAMLGHVDNVPDLLAAADVFAFPSLFEGLGGSLIEAMAMGVPVVTTDLEVTREVAADAAVYVPPADSEALGKSILRLLDDEVGRARMGNVGGRRFEDRFEFDAVMDRMSKLMREAAT